MRRTVSFFRIKDVAPVSTRTLPCHLCDWAAIQECTRKGVRHWGEGHSKESLRSYNHLVLTPHFLSFALLVASSSLRALDQVHCLPLCHYFLPYTPFCSSPNVDQVLNRRNYLNDFVANWGPALHSFTSCLEAPASHRTQLLNSTKITIQRLGRISQCLVRLCRLDSKTVRTPRLSTGVRYWQKQNGIPSAKPQDATFRSGPLTLHPIAPFAFSSSECNPL